MSEQEGHTPHQTFTDLHSMLQDHITLKTQDKKIINGFLHSVDPQTGTMIILTPKQIHVLPHTYMDTLSKYRPARNEAVRTELPSISRRDICASHVKAEHRAMVVVNGLLERHIAAEIVCDEKGERISVLGGSAFIGGDFCARDVASVIGGVLRKVRMVVDEIWAVEDNR